MRKRTVLAALLTFAASEVVVSEASAQTARFDLATGDALREVITVGMVLPAFSDLSPPLSDASLLLHQAVLVANSWFDAVVAYHPRAVGVYSNFPRRPAEESADNTNINVALFYSSLELFDELAPQRRGEFRALVESIGLDPDAQSDDPASPVHMGRSAARAVIAHRNGDGMNRLGDEGGNQYLALPYADYTGYEPKNTAYAVTDPSRWQPAITSRNGIFRVQQFVTPQLGITQPYSFADATLFRAPEPQASRIENLAAYRSQADEVLAASASLTDDQKVVAELFNDKLASLSYATFFASIGAGHSLLDLVLYEFAVNVATFDTAIVVWQEKRLHDAPRPFTAIRHLYGSQPVRAWGGVGRGTVDDLPGMEFRGYLNVADHPEYPSGSAAFCGAQAEVSRLFLGSDQLNFTRDVAAGSSNVEPGVTPARDLTVNFPTWSDFEESCGESRIWGGVHFRHAVVAGRELGRQVAHNAYRFVLSHIAGRPEKREQ